MRTKDQGHFQVIMDAIRAYSKEYGCSPTVMDISEATGISRATVARYLQDLINDGMVKSRGRRSYVIDPDGPMNTPEGALRIPVLGDVACGLPNLAEENIESFVYLPKTLCGGGDFYMLKARGYSMIDAGITNGDYVLIRRQSTAEPGEIVVALVEDEATLKRYFPEPEHNRIRLHPENRVMDDIIVSACIIQGVAVKVLKNL